MKWHIHFKMFYIKSWCFLKLLQLILEVINHFSNNVSYWHEKRFSDSIFIVFLVLSTKSFPAFIIMIGAKIKFIMEFFFFQNRGICNNTSKRYRNRQTSPRFGWQGTSPVKKKQWSFSCCWQWDWGNDINLRKSSKEKWLHLLAKPTIKWVSCKSQSKISNITEAF